MKKEIISFALSISVIGSVLLSSGCKNQTLESSSSEKTSSHISSITVEQSESGISTEDVTDAGTEPITNITDEARALIPNFDLKYFLTSLDEKELESVIAIYDCMLKFDDKCTLPQYIDPQRLFDIITVMKAECPELFHVDFDKLISSDSSQFAELSLKYRVSSSEYTKMRSDAKDIIDSIVAAAKQMPSDSEIEKYVFDHLSFNCTYDTDSESSDTAYGAIKEKSASSIGISLAMKWIMEECGIQCLCITADRSESDIPHAWNIIELDKVFYTLDLTPSIKYNDTSTTLSDKIIYFAFNVSDKWTENNYFIHNGFYRVANIPECKTDDEGYFARLGCFIKSGGDPTDTMSVQLRNVVGSGGGNVYIQFENNSDLKSFVDGISAKLISWFDENNMTYSSIRYEIFEYNVCIIYVNE